VTTNEPPTPYAPPGAALADGTSAPTETTQTPPAKPSRFLATLTSFFAYPLIGAGFLILGHRRPFRGWLTIGLALLASLIMGATIPVPRLCMAGIGGIMLAVVVAVIHTALTKPGNGILAGRAWLVALALVLGAKGVGLVVRFALVEAFQMPSGSMVPTLLVGDQIFVRKGHSGVTRGAPIVFKFPADRSTDYIKRIVAVGGETVEVRGGVVLINGEPLAQTPIEGECPVVDRRSEGSGDEAIDCKLVRETNGGRSYTIMFEEGRPAADFPRTTVPPDAVFVLGDNRDNSYDSRRWGTVPVDDIKGVATVVWWSKDNGGIRWSRIGHGIE
jgi:signal peptidase I